MRRYDLRVLATQADVSAALDTLLTSEDDSDIDPGSALRLGNFGLRPAGEATDLVLLVDDEDGLAGYQTALALRELGFHVEELPRADDVLEPADDAVADVMDDVVSDVVDDAANEEVAAARQAAVVESVTSPAPEAASEPDPEPA